MKSNDIHLKINGLVTFSDKNGQDIHSVSYSVIKSMKITNCSASGIDINNMPKDQTQIMNNNMTKSSNNNEKGKYNNRNNIIKYII